MVNARRWLILIFGLYGLLGVGYSLLMPVWEAPDEPAHYHLAWHLATYEEYPSYKINYENGQPRAYYYFSSWVIRALDTVNPELTRFRRPKEYVFNIRKPERRFEWTDENYTFYWGVYVLRWVNLIIGGIALWLNWKTFKHIAPPALALAALALAALTPQYLHIVSSVNNDALGALAGALLLYLAIRFLKESSPWLGLLLIPLAVLLPLFTKLTVLPVSAALLIILAWKWLFAFPQKRWLLYSALFILLGAGIFYLLFPETVQSAFYEIQWRLFSFRKNALTEKYIKAVSSQILWTYWGKVGWLAVGLPLWNVQLLTGLGVTGMLLQIYSLRKLRVRDLQMGLWIAVWLVAAFTVLAVFRNGLTTFATQGRLLFPAIGALSLLMVAGWHEILPERFQAYLPALIVLLFFCCNMVLWLTGILPVYFQPFLD
ncbi:MAG TPA: glycosyltransferase family 39 protein [Anaerolineales bacterium]|nr:glycosyltransferase family 39 protein [Anaerolineales bacterium]